MPTEIRPPRNRVVIGIAALAAGALIATTVALAGGPAPIEVSTAADAGSEAVVAPGAGSGPGAPAAGPAPVPLPDPTTPEPDGAATPVDAVRGFVGSLDAGNAENAYRLMHPRYRDAFDSYAEFAQELTPAPRFGPFAALGGAGYQSAVFEGEVAGEAIALVSVYGQITRDGSPVTEAMSMVARKADSGWLVEDGGEGGSVFQEPGDPGEQITAGDDLVLWTPSAGLSEVLAVVDGEPRDTVVTELVDPSETAEIRVDEYSPGGQQAAIGVLREDGSVDSVATYFLV
ncbi:MAG: hypothetical protein ACT4RN_01180 [Pseudonocardia sp.]